MGYSVKVHGKNGLIERKAEPGTNILQFLREISIDIPSPCGGNGKCGKCKVIVKGLTEKPSDDDERLLGRDALKKGYRLACRNTISSDIEIFPEELPEEASIITEGPKQSIELAPIVTKQYMELSPPEIHDQRSDVERIMAELGEFPEIDSIELIRSLPDVLRKESFKVTVVKIGKKLAAVEPGNTTGHLYGMAVDIGTTTIASYLYDLNTGEKTGVHSMLNPQRKFGADVLSRIDYALKSEDALKELSTAVVGGINSMIKGFERNYEIRREELYACVFAGNTTMMHLLIGVPPGNIAVAPFIPATAQLHMFRASELGIDINQNGFAIILPSVSAYIGADIVAGILSSGMYKDNRVTLLIDIGTNGEIVLGNGKRLFACSTAAGPAFEGANIRNGVGGIKGAIERIRFGEKLEFDTIGNAPAIGLCGSGIVDAVAGMVKNRIIDETGRIVENSQANYLAEEYRKRIVKIGGIRAFLILPRAECDLDIDIAITQKDVRELQNAKAAIAAGIKVLAKKAGIGLYDVEKVYLAGGFGSCLDVNSALTIGLLPYEFNGRIESIGNSAGAGASEVLLSREKLNLSAEIVKKIDYIELSALPDFVDEYVENMMFGI